MKYFFIVFGIIFSLIFTPVINLDAKAQTTQDTKHANVSKINKVKLNPNVKKIKKLKKGTEKTWLYYDDFFGFVDVADYTLRGTGKNIEVWVQNDLNFPTGDCRNDGVRNVITDNQVKELVKQFDKNMYPIESDWWGKAPPRDGSNAILPDLIGVPADYYKGKGDNIVVLVSNVRDDNYYDLNNANGFGYIAGVYISNYDEYFDRLVMTVDAYDWVHRTTANPPHNPTTNPCTNAPSRPFLYEGTFAHEYQHLLHHYADPGETTWINEGLSDFSILITGYTDLQRHIDEIGFESHPQCFLGWTNVANSNTNPIPTGTCGPENSLTIWGEANRNILADYGNALIYFSYLNSQGLGKPFFTALQHNTKHGIESINDTLASQGSSKTFSSLFDDYVISNLVDGYIDNGASVAGGTAAAFGNTPIEATVRISPFANSKAGAPPWGSDYIDLGAGSGLTSVSFDGDDEITFPGGTDWTVDGDGYLTNPDADPPNYGPDLDSSIARTVSGGGTLTFDHYYELETGFDYGFVQVRTSINSEWQSVACIGTTAVDPGAQGNIAANSPGFNDAAGTAVSPVAESCTLPANTTHISFRLMTDPLVEFDGWHVKNIQLNGNPVGDGTLAGWDNQKFFNPLDLDFSIELVGVNGSVDIYGDVTSGSAVQIIKPTLNAGNAHAFTGAELSTLSGYSKVIAIISRINGADESAEHAPYSLLVNGVERSDGQ